MRKSGAGKLVLVLLLLAGAFAGSGLWQLLSGVLPSVLAQSFTVGATSAPWTLDLYFMAVTFGLTLRVNIGSILGMLIALFVYFRL